MWWFVQYSFYFLYSLRCRRPPRCAAIASTMLWLWAVACRVSLAPIRCLRYAKKKKKQETNHNLKGVKGVDFLVRETQKGRAAVPRVLKRKEKKRKKKQKNKTTKNKQTKINHLIRVQQQYPFCCVSHEKMPTPFSPSKWRFAQYLIGRDFSHTTGTCINPRTQTRMQNMYLRDRVFFPVQLAHYKHHLNMVDNASTCSCEDHFLSRIEEYI